MKLKLIQFVCLALLFSSCRSIRISNRIEKAFLASYNRDRANGKTPTTFKVTDKIYQGATEYNMQTNSTQHGLNIRSIDVYLIDTVTGASISIDDFKAVEKLTKDNKESQHYLNKYKRQKIMRKVHRYGSYALIIGGIIILDHTKEIVSPSTTQRLKQNSGGYMLLGGFLNWTGGSFVRVLKRRATVMQAAYVYNFGKAPKSWTRLK